MPSDTHWRCGSRSWCRERRLPVVRYGPDGLQRPWEVFLTANRLLERQGEPAAFSMVAFTVDGEPVTSYGGVRVSPTGRAREDGLVIVPGSSTCGPPSTTWN